MEQALRLTDITVRQFGDNICVDGRVDRRRRGRG
jgi:hypothetical protein